MSDIKNNPSPKTRQEAYLLDLINDVVSLDKEISKVHQSVRGLGEEIPSIADNEVKRAGALYLAEMSGELIRVVKQNSGDANAAERQKTFAWAAGSLVGLSMFMFGAGMALGSQNGMGWGFLTVLALGVGFIGGLVALQLLVAGGQVSLNQKIENQATQPEQTTQATRVGPANSSWTMDEFNQGMKSVLPKTNDKLAEACRYVLIRKMDIDEAASNVKIFPRMVRDAVYKLQEWKKNN